jgi:hypothetical protein
MIIEVLVKLIRYSYFNYLNTLKIINVAHLKCNVSISSVASGKGLSRSVILDFIVYNFLECDKKIRVTEVKVAIRAFKVSCLSLSFYSRNS